MMHEKNKYLVWGIAALLIAVGAFFFFRPQEDEKIINRNLDRIVDLAQKSGTESLVAALGRSRDLVGFMTDDAMIQVGPPLPAISDKQELQGALIQVRQSLQTIDIRIIRRSLDFSDDRRHAKMELEAEATVLYAGESGRERRRFTIDWVRQEDKWLIDRVRLDGDLTTGNFRF